MSKILKIVQEKYRLISILIALGLTAYLFKGVFVVAMVNGKPLTRYSVIRELEKQGGKSAVDQLITESLIEQEARKQGISVLPKDVDEEMKKIEDNLKEKGQDLDTVLTYQGMTRSDFAKQIKLQKTAEKLLVDKLSITDQEIEEFITQNAGSFEEGTSDDEKKNLAREQLKQKKLSESFYNWLAEVKQNAKINYIVNY